MSIDFRSSFECQPLLGRVMVSGRVLLVEVAQVEISAGQRGVELDGLQKVGLGAAVVAFLRFHHPEQVTKRSVLRELLAGLGQVLLGLRQSALLDELLDLAQHSGPLRAADYARRPELDQQNDGSGSAPHPASR